MSYNVAIEPSAYVAGIGVSAVTFFGSLAVDASNGWMPLIVQAGMAGIVVLLLLKHIPQMMEAQSKAQDRFMDTLAREREDFKESLKEEREAHERIMSKIVESQSNKDEAWQHIVSRRYLCPVKKIKIAAEE